jgi:hypothetical protein
VTFDSQKFLTQLYEKAIKPMIETEALLESRPYITRLYTTMSADEMTVDPVFDFNPDLKPVSNVHTATRYMKCDSDQWRVDLGPAGMVQGTGTGTWPVAMDSQPAAMRILEYGTSGEGRVVKDRTEMIVSLNKAQPPSGGIAGRGAAGSGAVGGAGRGSTMDPSDVPGPDAGPALDPTPAKHGDGCAVDGRGGASALLPIWLACAALLRRRRKAG